jgi:hypothetical protein
VEFSLLEDLFFLSMLKIIFVFICNNYQRNSSNDNYNNNYRQRRDQAQDSNGFKPRSSDQGKSFLIDVQNDGLSECEAEVCGDVFTNMLDISKINCNTLLRVNIVLYHGGSKLCRVPMLVDSGATHSFIRSSCLPLAIKELLDRNQVHFLQKGGYIYMNCAFNIILFYFNKLL